MGDGTMVRTVFSAAFCSILAIPVAAQQIEAADVVDAGRRIYMQRCATCHGLEADGNGPMAPVLLVQPTALSRLEAGNGGMFPIARAVARIDGRDPLVSHGSAMPVYGGFFEGNDTALKTPSGQPLLTSRPIADLITYLISIQH